MCLIGAVLATGCGKKNTAQAETVVKKPSVKVTPAAKRMVDQDIEFTGTVEPFVQNNISPSMGIRIDKINVEVGDKVRKGQVLVEMDKQQFLQSQVQLTNLETDYARISKLYEQGGVSKQQLDQTKTQLDVLRHATQNLSENTSLISPISGVVTERVYDQGDIYSPSAGRVVTVMQVDKVKVKINVSEQYFPAIKMSMPVDVALDVYPGETFSGKVSLIYPALDPTTRTFGVEVTIANGNMRLRPGMFSKVKLNFGKAERVMIPDISVAKQAGSAERYVFVIDKNGVADRRSVKLGRVIGKEYEILSGVDDKDQVVIAGGQKLLDKAEVEVIK